MTLTEADFSQGFSTGFPRTAAFLRSRGVSPDWAEELAQSAWAKGWEARHQLVDRESLLAWVNTIALNLLRNSCRRASARGGVEINDRTLRSDCFEARVSASLDVHYLMIHLKPTDASLVKRCYLDGQTTAEASAQCAASPLALRLRLHRAVSRLRESVQHRGALASSEHAALTHAA